MIEVNIVIFLVISKYAYKIFKNWKKKEKRKRNTKYTSRSSIIFRWLKKLNFQNRKSNKNFSPPIFFFHKRETISFYRVKKTANEIYLDEANEDGYGNGDSFVENLFANEISPSGGSCETSSEQIVLHKRAERGAHDNSNLSYTYTTSTLNVCY